MAIVFRVFCAMMWTVRRKGVYKYKIAHVFYLLRRTIGGKKLKIDIIAFKSYRQQKKSYNTFLCCFFNRTNISDGRSRAPTFAAVARSINLMRPRVIGIVDLRARDEVLD